MTKALLKKAVGMLEDAKNIIDSLASEARDKYEELSEKAQEGDRGQKLDETATTLEEQNDALDEIISALNDIE